MLSVVTASKLSAAVLGEKGAKPWRFAHTESYSAPPPGSGCGGVPGDGSSLKTFQVRVPAQPWATGCPVYLY